LNSSTLICIWWMIVRNVPLGTSPGSIGMNRKGVSPNYTNYSISIDKYQAESSFFDYGPDDCERSSLTRSSTSAIAGTEARTFFATMSSHLYANTVCIVNGGRYAHYWVGK
jgi:hypothetical protein